MTEAAPPPRAARHQIVVLGAGIHDVVVLEKQPGLGGTWWDNRYPGAQVDVPAPAYAFSFAPNPEWKQRTADGTEHAHDAGLQARLEGSVWTQCRSWYRMDDGRVVAIFPGFTPEYVHKAGRLDPTDYDWG